MTFTECADAVQAEVRPEYLQTLYDKMVEDGSIDRLSILEEDYIRAANKKYGLFDHSLEAVLCSAREIRKNPVLVRYTNLLSAALADRETFRANPDPALPKQSPDNPACDFVGLIAMLPLMKHTLEEMQGRGICEEVIRANFKSFELAIDIHKLRFGWPAFSQTYFWWQQYYLDADIIDFGGFNFELVHELPPNMVLLKQKESGEQVVLIYNIKMHREGMVLGSADYTDEAGSYFAEFVETEDYFEGYPVGEDGFCTRQKCRYAKSEYEIVLRPGDEAIGVHIPRNAKLKGTDFVDACEGARERLAKWYPEFEPKAFVCFSWLMDPRIDGVCGGAPAIKNFQSNFKPFPVFSKGEEVFDFVFLRKYENYDDLPEDTRLMKAFKKRYLEGKHMHWFGGVLK